jgi:glycerate 2-kinase
VTTKLLNDALTISDAWSSAIDLRALIETQLHASDVADGVVDVVAVGKAAREMASAAREVLGDRLRRQLVIVDAGPAFSMDADVEFVIGEHPWPGLGSLLAGERLVEFLENTADVEWTIFLISGGASSLCALPQSPVDLDDLHELFAAALDAGADITTLNQLRAASSRIAGGAVLRRVRSARSLSLIMVDNVVSGARWVASGLTFDYEPRRPDVEALLHLIGRDTGRLARNVLEARDGRAVAMREPVKSVHQNVVIAEPSLVLEAVRAEAERRGFRVVDLGGSVHGDVQDIVTAMAEHLNSGALDGPLCVVGVGEATLRVRGSGVGGRCQDFAWRMAEVLDAQESEVVVAARATDGRDFVQGIAGGWVDETTIRRARERGIDWSKVVAESDSYAALYQLGQLIAGGRTGWNLCDVYLLVRGERT